MGPGATPAKSILMSDAGDGSEIAAVNLAFADTAATTLPDESLLTSGTYKPTDWTTGDAFAAPAPVGPYGAALVPFVGTDPNGTWSLYVVDDTGGDFGTMSGWCVNLAAVCGSNADCDDGNPCTDDVCTAGACSHTNNTNACTDNNLCTTGDVCTGGACVGTPVDCNDNEPCTTDACDPQTGNCTHVAVVCDDLNACTDDVCVNGTGCVYTNDNTNTCTDNDACTTDVCTAGQCISTVTVTCNDHEDCTDDTCDPQTGLCVYTPDNTNLCTDGNACTVDLCVNGACVPNGFSFTVAGTGPLTIPTGGAATPYPAVAVIPSVPGAVVTDLDVTLRQLTHTYPDDLDFLLVGPTGANATFMSDAGGGDDVTAVDLLFDDAAATPIPDAAIITSGTYSPANYTADTFPAPAPVPSGGAALSAFNLTNPAGTWNLWVADDASPDSGTLTSWSLSLKIACDDNNACTDDSCNSQTGCVFTPNDNNICTDGNICTNDRCVSGQCTSTPNSDPCDDGNFCTNDVCSGGSCVGTPNSNPCDDSDACTSGDICSGGACAGTAITCDDTNPCTDNSCNPATGCVFTNDNTNTCTDNNACTLDACVNGACTCPPGIQTIHVDSTDVPKPIPDPGTATSVILVSGAPTFLYDLNVKTFLPHTFAADLDVTITSPAGTVVTLTTDNGSSNDDVFNGTLWDDGADPGNGLPFPGDTFAASNVVTDTTYANLVLKTRLVPEEALGAFIGENPNGTWTLTAEDDDAALAGSIANWSIDISAGAAPTTSTTSFSDGTTVAIPDSPGGPVTATIGVSGVGTVLGAIKVTTNLNHPAAAELDVTLTSPAGTIVTLTSDNGLSGVFNGTVWDDKANPAGALPYTNNAGLVTDALYTAGTLQTPLVVEEALSAFAGENPNGTWTLSIVDDTATNVGSLEGWRLEVTTVVIPSSCAVVCADANVCTDDLCDTVVGCYFPPNNAPCNDANGCTGPDACSNGFCTGPAIPIPGDVLGMRYTSPPPDEQSITWTPEPSATRYDVVRGSLSALPVGPGAGDETCFSDVPTASLADPTVPTGGFFYVARGDNTCGPGPYGNTHTNPGPALNGPARTTTTCP